MSDLSFLEGRKLLAQWAEEYFNESGKQLNIATLRKRRIEAEIGVHIPPHAWYLTHDEFVQVTQTPLPQCKKVNLF